MDFSRRQQAQGSHQQQRPQPYRDDDDENPFNPYNLYNTSSIPTARDTTTSPTNASNSNSTDRRPSTTYSDRSSMSMQGHPTHHDDEENDHTPHTPFSPPTPEPNQPLLGGQTSPRSPYGVGRRGGGGEQQMTPVNGQFVSSPLNPRVGPLGSGSGNGRSRSGGQMTYHTQQGSWRSAGVGEGSDGGASTSSIQPLMPPNPHRFSQISTRSHSDASLMSYSEDSKYPQTGGTPRPLSGLIAYAYDPLLDHNNNIPDAEDDLITGKGGKLKKRGGFNGRGFLNVGALVGVTIGIVCLFTLYPVISFFQSNTIRTLITGNVRVNATGQTPDLPGLPQLIDTHTPTSAKSRTGFDGEPYELVFSDEFNTPNRSFFPGDDPFWEAPDIYYWATGDMEWYDPRQVTTRDGYLVLRMESVLNHNLNFRSGMLQSWNKFCFTGGYIEVSLSLPGRDDEAQGYWPGAWIMGNLGRPGYGATTDGMWPYSYDACDIGTFPNQTNQDHSAPPAALHTDQGRDKYNFELSWLTGQRLSACTCPGEDHPGPVKSGKFVGRGVPEIDILEAQKNKLGDGAKVSQSLQMAPFNADYQAHWESLVVNDTGLTARNSYNGSAVQQAISCLTTLPERIFGLPGSDRQFATFGFEYWSDPDNRDDGFVTWQSDGGKTFTAPAAMLKGDTASQISDRIVPEEPMSIILNLGISSSFQTVNPATLDFPAEFLVDYVRVYQRKGHTNVGCDGKDRPTQKYIEDHLPAYSNPNVTNWKMANYTVPKNGLYYNGC